MNERMRQFHCKQGSWKNDDLVIWRRIRAYYIGRGISKAALGQMFNKADVRRCWKPSRITARTDATETKNPYVFN